MKPHGFFNVPITIKTYSEGTKDKYGNPTKEFYEFPALCRLEPLSAQEILVDDQGLRDTKVEYLKIYLDDAIEIKYNDEVIYSTHTFKVYTAPQLYYDYNSPHHWEVKIRRNIV